ncbi:Crp/Fnr family transcriptional regulator [Lysinibacillus sp. 54212]|uniref:Crp/Fnr family transcriptional regulator n=1 Tax=Lysinibacillus sp. 54212 TaxID=3119829 RepID=UPI002FC7AC3D
MLTEHPSLLVEYLTWLQTENLKHQSRIRDLVLNGKKGALFSTLIRLANTYGEFRHDNEVFINFTLTNTEIANLCATSREMINRMLNDLKKHNIITFDKGYITILDLQFLKDEIACENCPLHICRID